MWFSKISILRSTSEISYCSLFEKIRFSSVYAAYVYCEMFCVRLLPRNSNKAEALEKIENWLQDIRREPFDLIAVFDVQASRHLILFDDFVLRLFNCNTSSDHSFYVPTHNLVFVFIILASIFSWNKIAACVNYLLVLQCIKPFC